MTDTERRVRYLRGRLASSRRWLIFGVAWWAAGGCFVYSSCRVMLADGESLAAGACAVLGVAGACLWAAGVRLNVDLLRDDRRKLREAEREWARTG